MSGQSDGQTEGKPIVPSGVNTSSKLIKWITYKRMNVHSLIYFQQTNDSSIFWSIMVKIIISVHILVNFGEDHYFSALQLETLHQILAGFY